MAEFSPLKDTAKHAKLQINAAVVLAPTIDMGEGGFACNTAMEGTSMVQLLLLMGFPPNVAFGTAIALMEEEDRLNNDTGVPEEACRDGYVFVSPTELNFTYAGDAEGVTIFGFTSGAEDAIEVLLEITDVGQGQSFSFHDPTHHCEGMGDGPAGGGGFASCRITITTGDWPVVPIVFEPAADSASATHLGWLRVSWIDSAGNQCEAGEAMLDGHVE